MWVDEIPLMDPGQDGPVWTWIGPGFPPEVAELERRRFAQRLLKLQRQFCLTGDPAHALTAMTWCQLYHIHSPPWVESTIARLAWSAVMAPTVIRGRRLRQVHWIRFAAVNSHLRQQQEAGVKRLNKVRAYREVSLALRGQPGRGSPPRITASYLKVAAAIRRGEVDRFALSVLDNRHPTDPLGRKRGGPVDPKLLEASRLRVAEVIALGRKHDGPAEP
jgi:hypothetical protein